MDSSSPAVGAAEPLSDFRRRLAFSLVLASTAGAALIFALLPPILPALAAHFGGGRTGELSAQLGLTMPSLGWLFGGGLSGWVIGRLGMRGTMIAAIAAMGLAGIAPAFLSDVVSFAVSRFALGFGGAFMITAAITLLAGIYDDATRPKMIGYQKAMGGLASIPIGLAVGGLADRFDWRAPFLLYALFAVVVAVLAFVAVPAASRGPVAKSADVPLDRAAFNRLFPILALIFFLQVLPIMGVAQLPFVLTEHGFKSATTMSLVLCLAAGLNSIGAVLSGYLQTRFGPWRVLCTGVALAGGGYMAIGIAPNGYAAAAANGVAILGCGLYFTQYLTLPLARVPVGARAKAIGLVQVATYLSAFLTPFLLSPVRGVLGHSGSYLAVGATATLALVGGISFVAARQAGRMRAAATAN
jgi:MFS family permease